jgi:hypothetical protein
MRLLVVGVAGFALFALNACADDNVPGEGQEASEVRAQTERFAEALMQNDSELLAEVAPELASELSAAGSGSGAGSAAEELQLGSSLQDYAAWKVTEVTVDGQSAQATLRFSDDKHSLVLEVPLSKSARTRDNERDGGSGTWLVQPGIRASKRLDVVPLE